MGSGELLAVYSWEMVSLGGGRWGNIWPSMLEGKGGLGLAGLNTPLACWVS